jgi:hypothetical protein
MNSVILWVVTTKADVSDECTESIYKVEDYTKQESSILRFFFFSVRDGRKLRSR